MQRTSEAIDKDTVDAEEQFPAVIGQPITNVGVPFGEIRAENGNTVKLRLIPDYLRDASGEPIKLNASKAIDVITALNGGVRNGTEQEIVQSVLRGEFKSGSYILARRVDLEKITETRKTNPSLEQFNKTISSGSFNNSWCVSSTEPFDHTSNVRHVRLRDGNYGWYDRDEDRSRVVLLRGHVCNSCNP